GVRGYGNLRSQPRANPWRTPVREVVVVVREPEQVLPQQPNLAASEVVVADEKHRVVNRDAGHSEALGCCDLGSHGAADAVDRIAWWRIGQRQLEFSRGGGRHEVEEASGIDDEPCIRSEEHTSE